MTTENSIIVTNYGALLGEHIIARWMERGPRAALYAVSHDERLRRIDGLSRTEASLTEVITASGKKTIIAEDDELLTDAGWVLVSQIRVGMTVILGQYEVPSPAAELWRRFRDTNYEVSNNGGVRSLGTAYHKARVLNPSAKGTWGHVKVRLGREGQDIGVHRIVCEAFNGPPQPGQECRHLNGLSADNRPENLVWGSRDENAKDASDHGRYRHNGSRRLSDEQISEIVARFGAGVHYKSIAAEYEIDPTYVHMLARGERRVSASRHSASPIVSIGSRGRGLAVRLSVADDNSHIADNFVVRSAV